MTIKQYDWGFSVVLSVCISSGTSESEVNAKSDGFCDFHDCCKRGDSSVTFFWKECHLPKAWDLLSVPTPSKTSMRLVKTG